MTTLERLEIRLQHGDHTQEDKNKLKRKIARLKRHEDTVAIQNTHKSDDEFIEALEKTDLPEVTNTVTSEG